MPKIIVEEDTLSALTDCDKEILYSVFLHRCLDAPLLYRYVVCRSPSFDGSIKDADELSETRLKRLIEHRLLRDVPYKAAKYPALFLTARGVCVVKTFYSDRIIAEYWQGRDRWKMFTAGRLNISPKNINHQTHLNHFALRFCTELSGQRQMRYYDGKFMPPASDFMLPDGMIEMDDCYLFLETDMSTEIRQLLAKKWESYRSFLRAPGAFYREKPIIMLFLLEGITRETVRKRHVTEQMMGYLADHIGINIEAYVDRPEVILSAMQKRYTDGGLDTSAFRDLQERHGLSLSILDLPSEGNEKYCYARRLTDDGSVAVENKCPQEWLAVNWFDGRCGVYRTLMRYPQFSAHIRKRTGRDIPLLLIVPSEKDAYYALRCARTEQPDRLYFTTPKRLQKKSLEQALFCIDRLENICHYTDRGFKETEYERRAVYHC